MKDIKSHEIAAVHGGSFMHFLGYTLTFATGVTLGVLYERGSLNPAIDSAKQQAARLARKIRGDDASTPSSVEELPEELA